MKKQSLRLFFIFFLFMMSQSTFQAIRINAELIPGSFHTDGPSSSQSIALTFDDGPGLYTQRVLDILDKHKIKATFFMNGDQVEIRRDLAKEVAKRGHEIADHTYSHLNFYAYHKKNGVEKTQTKARDEIRKSKEEIEKTLGIKITLCRMPNGFSKEWMRPIAKDFGYSLINWTYGEDWLSTSVDKMSQNYVAHVRPGAILLFHDGGKNREKTLICLENVITKAKDKKLNFLTVSELLRK